VGLERRLLVFRFSHTVERNGLVPLAAEAAYLKVAVACGERVAQVQYRRGAKAANELAASTGGRPVTCKPVTIDRYGSIPPTHYPPQRRDPDGSSAFTMMSTRMKTVGRGDEKRGGNSTERVRIQFATKIDVSELSTSDQLDRQGPPQCRKGISRPPGCRREDHLNVSDDLCGWKKDVV
jgi:hypothetical protein